ncbi:RHS repeat-associated core domain-containing protein, partial [Acidiluteibacter ferrifornacis]
RIRTAITDYMLSPYETDNLVFTPIEESEEMEMELESEISNGPEYAPNPEMSMELTSPNQLILFRGANGKTYSTTLGAFYEGEEASKAPDASADWTNRINLSGGADANWGTNGNFIESPSKVDYYRYDHLGNTRVVYEAEWDADLNQVKFNLKGAYDYFPYGKILRSYVPGNGYERYLTTQHERDAETISENNAGTGLDNRGARFYDSDVARFLSLDPAAAEYPSWSDYNYVLGNPVMFIDPDGKRADNWQLNDDKSLTLLKLTNDKTHNIFNSDGKLVKSTHMDKRDFSDQYSLEMDGGKAVNGAVDFYTSLTRAENNDAFNQMSQRADELNFEGGSAQMSMLKIHGTLNNTDNIIEGVIGSVTANVLTAFKGNNAGPGLGGISKLYSGLTKGNSLFNDIKNFSIKTYDDFTKGVEKMYDDVSRELNKAQDINMYQK